MSSEKTIFEKMNDHVDALEKGVDSEIKAKEEISPEESKKKAQELGQLLNDLKDIGKEHSTDLDLGELEGGEGETTSEKSGEPNAEAPIRDVDFDLEIPDDQAEPEKTVDANETKSQESDQAEKSNISKNDIKKHQNTINAVKQALEKLRNNGKSIVEGEALSIGDLQVVCEKALANVEDFSQTEKVTEIIAGYNDLLKELKSDNSGTKAKTEIQGNGTEVSKSPEARGEAQNESGKTESEKKEVYTARKLTSDEKEQVEEQRETDEADTAQEAPSDIFQKFKDIFNISEEDLEKTKFKELSAGQQELVLENLHQITLGRIQEEGAKEGTRGMKTFQKRKKGFFDIKGEIVDTGAHMATVGNNIWNAMTKGIRVAKAEKKLAHEIEKGGMDVHGVALKQLIDGMKNYGPDVKEVDGKLQVQFASEADFKGIVLSEHNKKAIEEYNQTALEFSHIPEEWSYKTANFLDRRKYKKAKEKYDQARGELINNIKYRVGGEKAMMLVNNFDYKVALSRHLNAHPDAEKEILNLKNQSVWAKSLAGFMTGKGFYMAMGYAGRTAAVGVVGIIGAPLAAAGLGSLRGYKRGAETIADQEKTARKGGKVDNVKKELSAIKNIKKEIQEIENRNRKKDGSLKNQEEWSEEDRKSYKEAQDKLANAERTLSDEARYKKLSRELSVLRNFIVNQYRDDWGEIIKNAEWEKEDVKMYNAKKEELKQAEKNLQKRGIVKLNYSSLEEASQKIEKLTEKLAIDGKNALDQDKRSAYEKALVVALANLQDKMAEGMIDYGPEDKRIENQYKLIHVLVQARVQLKSENLDDEIWKNFFKAVNERDSEAKKKRKTYLGKQIAKGAFIAGAFAMAGALIRGEAIGAEEAQKSSGGLDANKKILGAQGASVTPSIVPSIEQNSLTDSDLDIDSAGESAVTPEPEAQDLNEAVSGESEAPVEPGKITDVDSPDGNTGEVSAEPAEAPTTAEPVEAPTTAESAETPAEPAETPKKSAPITPAVPEENTSEELVGLDENKAMQAVGEIRSGDSVWSVTDRYLSSRMAGRFQGINLMNTEVGDGPNIREAYQTYYADKMKDVIVADPSKYGLPENTTFEKLTVEQLKKLDLNQAFKDAFPGGMAEDVLKPEQIQSIIDNNKALQEFFEKNPGAPRSVENFDKIIQGTGDTGVAEVAPVEAPLASEPSAKQLAVEQAGKKQLEVIDSIINIKEYQLSQGVGAQIDKDIKNIYSSGIWPFKGSQIQEWQGFGDHPGIKGLPVEQILTDSFKEADFGKHFGTSLDVAEINNRQGIYEYLQNLKKESDVEPKAGETVEAYISRAQMEMARSGDEEYNALWADKIKLEKPLTQVELKIAEDLGFEHNADSNQLLAPWKFKDSSGQIGNGINFEDHETVIGYREGKNNILIVEVLDEGGARPEIIEHTVQATSQGELKIDGKIVGTRFDEGGVTENPLPEATDASAPQPAVETTQNPSPEAEKPSANSEKQPSPETEVTPGTDKPYGDIFEKDGSLNTETLSQITGAATRGELKADDLIRDLRAGYETAYPGKELPGNFDKIVELALRNTQVAPMKLGRIFKAMESGDWKVESLKAVSVEGPRILGAENISPTVDVANLMDKLDLNADQLTTLANLNTPLNLLEELGKGSITREDFINYAVAKSTVPNLKEGLNSAFDILLEPASTTDQQAEAVSAIQKVLDQINQ